MATSDNDNHPKLVASTADTFNNSIRKPSTACSGRLRIGGKNVGGESNLFKEAQFSSDGTTIVTHNEDQCLRTFVLPTDLLEDKSEPLHLESHSSWPSSSNIQSYAIYPYFDLQDPSTTLVLSASAGVPISLSNALSYETLHAKYRSISPKTEEYYTSYSLAFSRDGSRFIAGSRNRLSIFDCAHDGSDPILTRTLAPGKKARKLYGTQALGSSGLVSALEISGGGVLAAGTTQREVALYGNEGAGELITAFSAGAKDAPTGGSGITSLKWSPDSTYLIVAERQSDSLQVYDVRNTMQRVSFLTGRRAQTTQRLGVDVVPTVDGYEVWAGGTDGCVRMWRNPGSNEGEQTPDASLQLHDDAVSSAIWHPGGAVLATCSGQRLDRVVRDDEASAGCSSDSEASFVPQKASPGSPRSLSAVDNKLKIWQLQ